MVNKKVQKTEGAANRGVRKTTTGLVVSTAMKKTVVVAVTRQVRHGRYGKFIRRTRRYMAHDERGICSLGDLVRIVEARPLSRHKRFRVEKIVTKAV